MANWVMETISVPEDYETKYHIPGVSLTGAITLCGWVDVAHEIHDQQDHPVDCETCIEIVRYCKKIKL